MTDAAQHLPPTIWKRRWKLLKISLWLCAAEVGMAVGYAIYTSKDNPLLGNITIAIIGYATAAALGYIFGASYDDKNLRDAIVKIKTAETPQ